MLALQIVVRCTAQPEKHAKILRMRSEDKTYAENLATLLDGTSAFYIHKPGPDSPIGKCATCGAPLTATVEEIEVKDAKTK